jgi:hypothetical protein
MAITRSGSLTAVCRTEEHRIHREKQQRLEKSRFDTHLEEDLQMPIVSVTAWRTERARRGGVHIVVTQALPERSEGILCSDRRRAEGFREVSAALVISSPDL